MALLGYDIDFGSWLTTKFPPVLSPNSGSKGGCFMNRWWCHFLVLYQRSWKNQVLLDPNWTFCGYILTLLMDFLCYSRKPLCFRDADRRLSQVQHLMQMVRNRTPNLPICGWLIYVLIHGITAASGRHVVCCLMMFNSHWTSLQEDIFLLERSWMTASEKSRAHPSLGRMDVEP